MTKKLMQKLIDKMRGNKKLLKKRYKFSQPDVMENTRIDAHSMVGDYTYIGYNCFVTKAQIGRYCSIGNNVSIGPGEHAINHISTSHFFVEKDNYAELTKKDCVIKNDVWIGVDAIIRRGVIIGNGAIVGANSFVNSDVPDFAVVAGNPAKILKYRFDENKILKIQKSKWWEFDVVTAKEIIKKIEKECSL